MPNLALSFGSSTFAATHLTPERSNHCLLPTTANAATVSERGSPADRRSNSPPAGPVRVRVQIVWLRRRGRSLTRPTGAQLWQIISDTREGILATINDDGSPQLSNVYYLADSSTDSLRLSTTTVRTKGRNLQRDPRATLHTTGMDFLNFAIVDGHTTLSIPRQPNDSAIEELFELHTALGAAPEWSGFGEEMIAAGRMVVRLSVKRIYGQIVNR